MSKAVLIRLVGICVVSAVVIVALAVLLFSLPVGKAQAAAGDSTPAVTCDQGYAVYRVAFNNPNANQWLSFRFRQYTYQNGSWQPITSEWVQVKTEGPYFFIMNDDSSADRAAGRKSYMDLRYWDVATSQYQNVAPCRTTRHIGHIPF